MALLLFLLLILAALTGALASVLKIAAGVALGLFVGVALVATFAAWRIRRAVFGPRPPRWRRIPGSRVEVLERRRR